eukprot:6349709-Amphidinium_carterae.1
MGICNNMLQESFDSLSNGYDEAVWTQKTIYQQLLRERVPKEYLPIIGKGWEAMVALALDTLVVFYPALAGYFVQAHQYSQVPDETVELFQVRVYRLALAQ